MCSTRQRLASLLRDERSVLGLTLRQAAQRAKIAPSTLSRWESGTCVPRVPELEALLGALDMPNDSIRRILASLDAPRAARAVRTQIYTEDGPVFVAPTGGMLLKALRHKAKLSLTEVAHRLNVAPSTVSRWEAASAHPGPDIFDQLIEVLQASPEERECLIESGVAKLKTARGEYLPERFEQALEEIETAIELGGDSGTELKLLQLQSELWWSIKEPRADKFFRRAQCLYTRFLLETRRYLEAIEQAQAAIEASTHRDDEIGVMTYLILARADVFRWPAPRPHLGLYVLQPLLHRLIDNTLRAPVLTDMAEYSRLAGRISESLNYAVRAAAVAGNLPDGDMQARANIALGLAHASLGDGQRAFEAIREVPTDSNLTRAWRSIAKVEAYRRLGQMADSEATAREARTYLAQNGLEHLSIELHHAEQALPQVAY